ncbi:MAG: hypothetical protein ABH848_05350 [Candidatus Omnitrophota bacterium]
MKQKKWDKPELIVLLRGEPGEDVLIGQCKTDTDGTDKIGPMDVITGCRVNAGWMGCPPETACRDFSYTT